MIRRNLSVGPHRRLHGGARPGRFTVPLHCRGFSVVEVLMSLVLLAISVALALPSYREMVEKRQITNGAEQLTAFINSAQGIAQRQNRRVTIAARGGDDLWCVGMAEDDAICDCENAPEACTVDGQQYVIDNSIASNKTLMHAINRDSDALYIDPLRGLVLPCDIQFELCAETPLSGLQGSAMPLDIELRSISGDYRLNLQVNYTGRITLCSQEGHEIPGYETCP